MDFSQAFAISAAGMAAERARVDVAALNLANANTVQSPDGTGYQPMRVLTRTLSAGMALPTQFAEQVDAGLLESASNRNILLPQSVTEPTGAEPRSVYEPGNPFANSKGFVTYPGVDTATEMVNMMGALRAYEANVAAMNMTRTLALKALDIGGANS